MSEQLQLDAPMPVQRHIAEARAAVAQLNHKRRSQRRCRLLSVWSQHMHAMLEDGAKAVAAMARGAA